MKKFQLISLLIILTVSCQQVDFKNPELPVETRVESILSQMNLDEKLAILQIESDTNDMQGISFGKYGFLDNSLPPREAAEQYNAIQKYTKEKTRFGIPGFKSGEGIFAYMAYKTTSFPQPIGQAASWDPQLVAQVADIISEEMKSRGVRNVLSPVLNMGRDPRWGRTGETYGEDPYLVSQMGLAYVKKLEGKGMLTCLKHFAGNTSHNGQFGAPVFYSERYYREYEFLPYEVAIKEGGAKSVMMAYNTADGIPCTQSEWMMKSIIKGEWAFDGIIYSDGGGLDLIRKSFGIDTSCAMIVAKAINNGCDVGLDSRKYFGGGLKQAIQMGLVKESTVDESVRRVLRQIFRTGLYDQPFVDANYAEKINDCEEHRAASLEVAKKTMVLLKNENVLPFEKSLKNILVTGPLADQLVINHYGGWGRKTVSVLEGCKNLLPNTNFVHKPGCGLGFTYLPSISEQFFYHMNGNTQKRGLRAEYYSNTKFEGQPINRIDKNIDFDWGEGAPEGLPTDHFSVRWTGMITAPYTGRFQFTSHADNQLSLYFNDSLIVDMTKGTKNALFSQFGEVYLKKGESYRIRAEYIENTSKAYVHLGWNAEDEKLIDDAVETARKMDAIIVVVGMYDDENADRAQLELDPAQEKLIISLSALNKPMTVIIQTGTVIAAYNWAHLVPSILVAWYPGEEGGNAIAQTLFGDNNPGGKLPITFPKTTGQVPLTYNLLPGRPNDRFIGYGNKPLYCFGHGLSYTTFEYSDLQLSNQSIAKTESVTVNFKVKNTGKQAGDEVVQLYLHDVLASVSRPVKELKAFQRVSLNVGESKNISFVLGRKQLEYFGQEMKRIVEPGEFHVMIGSSSEDIRLKSSFWIK